MCWRIGTVRIVWFMKVLITGGIGFIGTNAAAYFLSKKHPVTILDNFSRKGSTDNAKYLLKKYPRVHIVEGDVRNYSSLRTQVKKHEVVFHFAGQVAVTTSIENPRLDFENNLLGTFNVLEAARLSSHKPIIIDSSTNKVYGKIYRDIKTKGKRYIDTNHEDGIAETEPLDFYSPYSCSKGASDQYVRDYARIFHLPTVVFRQSCIYGPHQYGIEDQGWIAHFAIHAMLGKPITIYGKGFQVRDVLFIDDLVDAYEKAIENIGEVKGEIFNIGGGKHFAYSLLEIIDMLEKLLQRRIDLRFEKKRPADQDIYISDITKAQKLLYWKPKTSIEMGLSTLIAWIEKNKNVVRSFA